MFFLSFSLNIQSYATVLSVLKHGMQERKVEVKSSFLTGNVEFCIDACDSHGRYMHDALYLCNDMVLIHVESKEVKAEVNNS